MNRTSSVAIAALAPLLAVLACQGVPSRDGASPPGEVQSASRPVAPSGLPYPPGKADVPRPAGAPGGLRVLDWAGFTAAVTYTFDDANSSQIEHYATLQELGVPFTFYLSTSKAEATDPVWAQAVLDGHELGNHSHTHPRQGTALELDLASDFLRRRFGVEAWTMAAPYGSASYTELARPRFLLNRGVMNGVVTPNDHTDPFSISCYVPPQGAEASAFDREVDSARSAGGWRVVLVHGFTGGTDAAYQPIDLADFVASVEYAKSLGDVWIDTMVNVGAYWRGQKAFLEATPTVSGDARTWTWTLPDRYPPGKFLRVTVTGGTLSQGGEPLAWDPHGFYEVALDAGSLTLASAPPA